MTPVLRLRILARRYRRPPCETVACARCQAAGRERLPERTAWHAARRWWRWGRAAYVACFECGHVYRTAGELWRRYVAQSFRIFLVDIRPAKGGISLTGFDGGGDVFLPFTPPRFARLLAPWFLVRSLVRWPSRITFCQECLHDF